MVTHAVQVFPTARDDVLLRRVGSEWVLFDSRHERAHVLNLTAAVVWTYCDGSHGSDAIAEAIARAVEGEEARALQTDIEQVLRRFADEGLLR
jgi:Coenzyme PQQ synthesis protein D (PqqD)